MDIVFDYTNWELLIIAIVFFFLMNLIGYIKKDAWFAMASLLMSIAMVMVHIMLQEYFSDKALRFNVFTDLAFMAVSISLMLIVDEIETRRGIIKNVFENKYNHKKKK